MFNLIKTLSILSLLILCINGQQPTPSLGAQDNFIDPIVIQADNSIPAEPIIAQEPVQAEGQLKENAVPENIPEKIPDPPTSQGIQAKPQQLVIDTKNQENIQAQIDLAEQQQRIANAAQQAAHQAAAEEQRRKAQQAADQAKLLAIQARKQAEFKRRQIEAQQQLEIQKIAVDGSMNKTERQKQIQRIKFKRQGRKVEQGTRFTEYLFDLEQGPIDFFINIPATQQVALNVYTYVSEDNTYIRTKDIEGEEPVHIYIYENNERIVFQTEFFFQIYATFEGKANSFYLVRIINKGKTKLISMSTKKLLEHTHIQDSVSQSQGLYHVGRTQNLAIEINKWFQQHRKIRMLDFQDIKKVEGHIRNYWTYEILQTIVAVVLCLAQIKMIQKTLSEQSIV